MLGYYSTSPPCTSVVLRFIIQGSFWEFYVQKHDRGCIAKGRRHVTAEQMGMVLNE